jgi:uncharacterized protein (TIGR02217 family)
MSFIESPRFPEGISYGAIGGPEYSTDVVEIKSGSEQRNANWSASRSSYDVSHGVKTQAELDTLIAFFRACKGRAHGFRFKDFTDYRATHANGVLGTGIGSGLPAYQLGKNYTSGSETETRPIRKPVTGTVALLRGGDAVTFGSAPGNAALDATTGTITFVADASVVATSGLVGATSTLELSDDLGFMVGEKMHLSGFTGADAGLVNNQVHTILSITGAGPYTFELAVDTAGKDIAMGSGTVKRFPQSTEQLTWAGEFDVPCRFDTDQMRVSIDSYQSFSWGGIPIIEIRV